MARSKVSKTGSKARAKHTTPATHSSTTNGSLPHATLPGSQGAGPGEPNGRLTSIPAPPGATVPAQNPAAHAAELTEKVKELVRLAQEQGYLTYGDINDALPD